MVIWRTFNLGIGDFLMNRIGFKSGDDGSCDVQIQNGKLMGDPYREFGSDGKVLTQNELASAYEKISCIGTGIDLIANNMQMIDPVFWNDEKREAVEYPKDVKLKLFRKLLENPNATDDRMTSTSKAVKNYTLFGAVYYAFILDNKNQIISINVLDEFNLTPSVDIANSRIDDYIVMNSGAYNGTYVFNGKYYADGQKIIAPLINNSPYPQYMPASILQGCGIETLLYWFGCYHNKSLLSNGARPSLIFLIKTMLNKKHREQLREEIRVRHSGAGNAGSAVIIDGSADKDVKQFSQNNKDMEFNAVLDAAESAIQKRLGTNWILDKKVNSKDIQKGTEMFYDMTVCPMFQRIFNHLFDVFKYFNPTYNYLSIFYLEQDIPALRPRFLAMMKDIPGLQIFTVAERRKMYNYPPLGDERDNELVVQTVKVTQNGNSGTNDTEFTGN